MGDFLVGVKLNISGLNINYIYLFNYLFISS